MFYNSQNDTKGAIWAPKILTLVNRLDFPNMGFESSDVRAALSDRDIVAAIKIPK